jgi:ornithine--oxo-acid transaminase
MANIKAEAIESAIKATRRWAYEVKLVQNNSAEMVFMKGHNWGKTLAACSASNDPRVHLDLGDADAMKFTSVIFNDLEMIEHVIKSKPNLAGVVVPSMIYDKGIKKLSKDYFIKI